MTENFIHTFKVSDDVCDQLIEYHKNNSEYKQKGTVNGNQIINDVKESVDVTFYTASNHQAVRTYFNELQIGYTQYCDKFNLHHYNLRTEPANNVQFYPPGGGFKVWHSERSSDTYNRQLVYMTYLNTVDNGGTEWLYQEFKLDAVKGLSVIWPADFAWTHRGVVSQTNEKWIATGWFSHIM